MAGLCQPQAVFGDTGEQGKAGDWRVIAEQKISYTDDVAQFSAVRRQNFNEDPSQPTVVQDRRRDVVWEPSVDVLRRFSNALGRSELSLKGQAFLFTDNPSFTHAMMRLQYRQFLGEDTSLLVRYRYTPNMLLGPNTERRTGHRLVEDERTTSHTWRLELERRLSSQWTMTLINRYGLRLYNDAYAERDTQFYTVGPQVRYKPTEWSAVKLGYLYERGLADGRGDTRFNDDVSYRQHAVLVGLDGEWASPWALHLTYIFRRKDFTSDLAGDSHLGRHDLVHQGTGEVEYRVNTACSLLVSIQRTQRSSTTQTKDFHDTIASIGMRLSL